MPYPDYHTHTSRCGHAIGRPEEYVREAVAMGLTGIGVADHLPLLPDADPTVTMSLSELDDYVEEVLTLREAYPGFVLLGVEADYRPHTISDVKALLDSHPFDYVIGSVHYLGQWGIDDERQIDGYSGRDIDQVWVEYLGLVGDAAESGAFTILGHLDLAKRFGFRPTRSLSVEFERLVERIAKAGVLVEINTAGLRRSVGEAYPSPEILTLLCEAGVDITFGSDAHRPSEVGRDFDQAVELAQEAGYTRYARLVPRADGGRAETSLEPLPAV